MSITSTKHFSLPRISMVFILTIIGMGSMISSFAHNLCYANPRCFSAGQAVTVPGHISVAGFILPVVLTPLKAFYSTGVAHLTWRSLQESNSSHFEIQRGTDGANFSYLGKVTAMGSSDKDVLYNFADIKANAGMNYYRLKLIDKDGHFQYSNIVAVYAIIKGITITSIYPNPFMDKVEVSVASETREVASIQLFDNTGKLVATQQAAVNKGANTITLPNLAQLAKGFYMIKVQVGESILTQKLMK